MVLFKKKKYIKELETALKYTLSRNSWWQGESISVVYDAYHDSSFELIRTYNEEWDAVYFKAHRISFVDNQKDKKQRKRRVNRREKTRLNRKIKRANYTEIIKDLEIKLEKIIDLCIEHTEEIYSCESTVYLIRDVAEGKL